MASFPAPLFSLSSSIVAIISAIVFFVASSDSNPYRCHIFLFSVLRLFLFHPWIRWPWVMVIISYVFTIPTFLPCITSEHAVTLLLPCSLMFAAIGNYASRVLEILLLYLELSPSSIHQSSMPINVSAILQDVDGIAAMSHTSTEHTETDILEVRRSLHFWLLFIIVHVHVLLIQYAGTFSGLNCQPGKVYACYL